MIRYMAFLLPFLWFATAQAKTQVAFFEYRTPQGELVTMESGGHYIHVPIAVGNKWLHTHPYYGVQLVDSLSSIGNLDAILTDESLPALKKADIQKYLNLKYDATFDWDAKDKTYCSKLIAQILHLEPSPMSFSGNLWVNIKVQRNNLGISPDDVYQQLLDRGFKIDRVQCRRVFH